MGMQQQHNYTRALQGFVIITVIIIIGILVGRWLGGLPDEQKVGWQTVCFVSCTRVSSQRQRIPFVVSHRVLN